MTLPQGTSASPTSRAGTTPRQDARAVLRLIDRERRLTAQLRETRDHMRSHAQRLCDGAGYRVILNGPALERLAVERVSYSKESGRG